jgi:hypothetical protein
MRITPGRLPRRTRLARALGLDRNPLRRASDRAEAWIRIGLLAVFLIVGPIAALSTGGGAYRAGITAASVQPVPSHPVSATVLRPALAPSYLNRADQQSQAPAGTWRQSARTSARANEVLAVVITLALIALALLAAQRLTRALLTRRRLAAWEAAWSRVGPQWSRGRP